MKEEVYYIGYGQVSSAGASVDDLKHKLCNVQSNICKSSNIQLNKNIPLYCGEVKNISQEEKFMCMTKQAMWEAIDSAGLSIHDFEGNEKAGFVYGTSLGNTELLERYYMGNIHKPMKGTFISDIGYMLRKELKVKGFSLTLTNTCCTGLTAISIAKQMILDGTLDICLVGCTDMIGNFIVAGMDSMNALSKKEKLQPFSSDRDGMILGEAAAFVVLANQKYKNRKGIVGGCSVTNDATHLTAPDREARGLCLAITESLQEADISENDIDVIYCCGNGTVYNDSMQAMAIHKIWGNKGKEYPVTTIKPLVGHTLSASGVLETIGVLCMMQGGFIIPIGERYEQQKDDKSISLAFHRMEKKVKNAVLLSSGFSGVQAAQVIRMG